jgi:hypothetical protein
MFFAENLLKNALCKQSDMVDSGGLLIVPVDLAVPRAAATCTCPYSPRINRGRPTRATSPSIPRGRVFALDFLRR